MNKLLKRLLSGAVAAAMVIGMLVLPQFAMAADVDPVISVTFDEGSDAYILENGASLADGRNGKALSLTTEGDQYAQLNYMCIADKNVDDSSVSFKLCGAQNKSITDMRAYAAVYSGSSLKSVASREIKSSDITSDSISFSIPVTKSEGDTVKLFVWDDMEPVPEGSDTAANFASLNGNYSISVWAKPESNAVWNRIYDLGGGTVNYVFLTVSEGSAPRFAVKHNSEQSVTAGDAVTLNEWHNFVLTRDGNLTSMYIDGFLVSSTSEISFHPSDLGTFTQMYLGKSQWPDPYFKGMIDDFAVYDYALGEDKIHELAAEVYQSKRKQLIYDNNCYILDTKFYDKNGTEIFKLDNDENIKIVSNIKNYTGKDGSVTATVYAVAATDDTETAIDGATTTEVLKSLDEKDIVINVASNKIPANTSKLIVKTTTPNGEDTETATTATLYKLANAPVAAPADSNETTIGAHDPSIVKFGDTYYAYSSHHLIFTSKDLINWKKYDFTNINAKDITPKTYSFISSNYANTTMNGTYWAPDVIYKEGDAHPYWMYISISCGLGGRNSAISLMKSDNPLFWADSSSDIVDAGVVFATKENSSYVTNAIDANIYTDTSDNNKQYFVWGSFWGGIQAVPLTADGLVQGVDYTSNSTILSSCANVKTTIFSQRGGVAGPEGAWMIEHGGYRYAFTSYGWLGSNYNTRIARAPKTTTFATNTGTQLLDANGTVMGTQHTAGSTSMPSGYKLIGSYRLGDGGYTLSGNDSDGYSIPREAGDAHIYYGPGHNSAINVGDESFYVSHTRKDATEIAATLQVRKMLWTSDGWPVVSPVTYAGEKEQALPEEMLTGTYDLASVGHMKMSGSTIKARNFDLPVVSSKITLGTDMSMKNASGASIGTWTFDGDHTVTLTFTANGDTTKDEFYKTGDTMTLFALYGYDKDEAEPVIALTGTDQNHITQFAKKSAANVYRTTPEAVGETTPITLAKSTGGNPELGFDTNGTAYAGDPAALVDGDTVYMYVGHDTAENEAYKMPEWLCYSSKNMTDWKYEGVVMKATDISWRSNDTSAWASQCVKYGGKYYLYYCTWDKTASGKQSIGVAVSDSPTGPFTDPLGKPLVSGSFTTPESNSHDDIDPTVLIDTVDGVEHRYLAWGNTRYYVCELNEDMTSVKDIDGDGEIVMHKDIKEKKIKSLNGNIYTEAPWLYKRADKYYLFFAANWREEMAYAMTDNPFTGRYDYIQTIMPPTATSNTNHPAVIDFNDKTYFIYHNGALPHGSGFRRSVCIDELKFDENGYVYPVTETSIGLNGTASVIKTSDNKYLGHDAFRNPLGDSSYPLSVSVTVSDAESEYNTAWEIKPAKAVPQGEDANNYVSIQSVDKPGLYISVSNGKVTLTQDADGKQGTNMTFKTVRGLDGNNGSVSFESVSEPGKFLTVLNKSLTVSYGNVAADATFTIDAATTKPNSVVSVAEREADPTPEADITQDFNSAATGSLIHLATTDTPAYTALSGVTLYIGTRGSGQDTSQNFSIASGGVTGNALVLSAGNYQSASRGGRMAINTPVIPNGYTVTAEIKVKQGSAGSELRFNDSTTSEAGTTINGLSNTEWKTFKVAITNNEDTYTRTIMLGDNVLATDYIDTFPVLWGTVDNKTGQSIYFDDLTIKTTTASGETPEPVTYEIPEGYTSYYSFDGNLTDSEAVDTAVTVGWDEALTLGQRITTAKSETAAFDDSGYKGKAVKFTGNGTDGVKLGKVITNSKYTVSFYTKINAFTAFTAGVFIDADGGSKWVSAPIGWKTDKNLMVWSNDGSYIDLVSSFTAAENTWYQVTIAANDGTATMYINGKSVGSGNIANIADANTNTYLALNYWDTPFNGLIDEMYIYNGSTLNANQVKALYEATKITE